ncbi:hypothetical protein EW146_g6891 [Bondarzewia mesenterica]|uniref:C2H2-type domain-containing protein n=1 Tax=Bondarzewia mesenterica TaxID=1095465 RepID=A0A4S4LN24_9AGAM|nr:hypothetical protein EW146_g6891 [Bondarzewia mesenterica]
MPFPINYWQSFSPAQPHVAEEYNFIHNLAEYTTMGPDALTRAQTSEHRAYVLPQLTMSVHWVEPAQVFMAVPLATLSTTSEDRLRNEASSIVPRIQELPPSSFMACPRAPAGTDIKFTVGSSSQKPVTEPDVVVARALGTNTPLLDDVTVNRPQFPTVSKYEDSEDEEIDELGDDDDDQIIPDGGSVAQAMTQDADSVDRPSSLMSESRSHRHPSRPLRIHRCIPCDQNFHSSYTLERHLKTTMRHSSASYLCGCGKMYMRIETLRRHACRPGGPCPKFQDSDLIPIHLRQNRTESQSVERLKYWHVVL